MHWRWMRPERWLPTPTPAGQSESFLFPLSWNTWEAGVVRPFIRSGPLVATRANIWASPLLKVFGTHSNAWPFHCGKEMPHYGSVASQPAQPQWMVLFRCTCKIVCFLFFALLFCVCCSLFGCLCFLVQKYSFNVYVYVYVMHNYIQL